MGSYKQSELLSETGGKYWYWQTRGDQYVPAYSHSSVRNRVHFSLLRTLYENDKLPKNSGSFFIHGGCEAISPVNAASLPYNSPNYGGNGQIAECLMYYGNGLALIGRAKVYFDIPKGFDKAFGSDHGCFGDILKTYFEIEANDKGLANSVASRNRTYFWSILGDWTLKLKYEKPVHPTLLDKDLPATFTIRPERLEWIKKEVESGNPVVSAAMNTLIEKADQWLKAKPVSVTDNKVIPPSGDPRDYMSFGPYWWPNPDTKNGLPYIRRDGEINPAARDQGSDFDCLNEFIDAVEYMSLAYYFKNDERYAKKAVEFLDTFFLNERKRMNPNMKFAEAIPGRTNGRSLGIIDTRKFASVIDSIQLIKNSDSLSSKQYDALQQWFSAFLDWLIESPFGNAESAAPNNHGTFYDVQVVSIALFIGKRDLAKKTATAALTKRVRAHIEIDGSQPKELVRTNAYSYSMINLRGIFRLARLAEHVDVDLWNYGNPNTDPFLKSAFLYIAPHFGSLQFWPHKEIDKERERVPPFFLITEASEHYPDNLIKATQQRYFEKLADLRMLLR